MARPKIHGERVEWKIRVPTDLATQFDERVKSLECDRTAALVHALKAWLGAPTDYADTEGSKYAKARAEVHAARAKQGAETIKQGQETVPVTHGSKPPRTSPPKPSNCPHKYRVKRGSASVCVACGDER